MDLKYAESQLLWLVLSIGFSVSLRQQKFKEYYSNYLMVHQEWSLCYHCNCCSSVTARNSMIMAILGIEQDHFGKQMAGLCCFWSWRLYHFLPVSHLLKAFDLEHNFRTVSHLSFTPVSSYFWLSLFQTFHSRNNILYGLLLNWYLYFWTYPSFSIWVSFSSLSPSLSSPSSPRYFSFPVCLSQYVHLCKSPLDLLLCIEWIAY